MEVCFMKNLFWKAMVGSLFMLTAVACTSPQAAAPTESQPEIETQAEPKAIEEMSSEEDDEIARENSAEAEEEPAASGPSASEIAAMEKAAAGALKDENRAPTFRGNNGADSAEDIDPDAVKSLADYLPVLGAAPEVINGEPWINSEPLTLESLKGKVVLIEFWTYS